MDSEAQTNMNEEEEAPFSNDTAEAASHMDRMQSTLIAYVKERIPDADETLICDAIEYSLTAHQNQFRRSGMPYMDHPFEVAKLLADFHMDSTTIAAALLHDVVEDTAVTVEDIKNKFGEEIAFLVDAVTKLSAIQARSRLERQAETFRKMLISMAKDFRVILIKFADRLHNMRTLGYMNEEKKRNIATETLEVYAPLAHRFGLAKIRWELEDLSFKALNPGAYKNIVQMVVEKRNSREEYVRQLLTPVKELFEKEGIKARVFGRPKHLYSIFRKLETRQCQFEDLYDLFALRIIVGTVPQCYNVLGLIHNLWTPLQTRFKDYIATPKSNMYQSLHTAVIGPQGRPIEVQIRTEEMDLTAEYGIAAHWAYKEGENPKKLEQESRWLSQFMEWQKDLTDSSEFMDFFRIDLKTEEIFVFTPKGDLIRLPKGATALDFAFSVHTEVGVHCIGAKVEGKIVPIDRALQTGSTVEILKSENQRPSRDWLRMVITAKAKNRIRRWMKSEGKEQSTLLGKELLQREFRTLKIPRETQDNFAAFSQKFDAESWEDLYEKIGNGDISLGSVVGFLQILLPDRKKGSALKKVRTKKSNEKTDAVLVSGISNMLIRFATCCNPVPGDPILGYVTKGRGVSIHRANCPEGLALSRDKDRMVPVQWVEDEGAPFDVYIEVTAKDKPGLLSEITLTFTNLGINIQRASIVTVNNQVRNRFKLHVSNLKQLDKAFSQIKKIKEVRSVSRREPSVRSS